ncbi:YciI family protein [Kribbella sp. NPDC004875]|uniref:YciI family protein n=1 Tax=Kribbella sp. NPDC004875 TaxID=3364107 RepID=UPI0036B4A784
MAHYLISFANGAMDHVPAEELPDVAKAGQAVIQEAKDAGVFRFAGGLNYGVDAATATTDGLFSEGPFATNKEQLGGIFVVNVPTRTEALEWAAKVAAACRCPQDLRKFMDDPEA